MGLIADVIGGVFGGGVAGGRNVIAETAAVFIENAEAQAQRDATLRTASLDQFGREFLLDRSGWWDRFIDGLNRLPRPMLALGTIGLFVCAMVSPDWFAARMAGLALVPEPLWWLMGAVVSFYFGARHQVKAQEFQRSIATTIASTSTVAQERDVPSGIDAGSRAQGDDNPALAGWSRP
ncbi:holin family protein [Maritimibacter sp. DP1N21-5]|uniref:holin family protein n=1 Tax=Maritimibacter sp. DP1N21-5 TaxID=2836867 RepID=UPI001C450912|nr:holin family protein [Maritimibacter sp. DP1N21-5]MBV7409566.1 holin family protein [Maritimibacter sp. DP1N21-5]